VLVTVLRGKLPAGMQLHETFTAVTRKIANEKKRSTVDLTSLPPKKNLCNFTTSDVDYKTVNNAARV